MSDEKPDEYLWDRSGEPDDQVRRLEELLERYRFERQTPPDADVLECAPPDER